MSKDPHIIVPEPIFRAEDVTLESVRGLSKDNFAYWCLDQKVKVDNNLLEFERHKYLFPIYMDPSRELVLVKAAQLGATVYQLLRILWFLQMNQGTKAGLYFPNKDLADEISKDRLSPMLESSASLLDMTDSRDALSMRKIGKSTLYMRYLEGKSSKDSIPMDYLSFDEVRLSSQQSIDQVMERIAHSSFKYRVYMSTCGLPNDSIHKRFMDGTQYIWTCKCGCFSYDTQIWVRNKDTKAVSCKSFNYLSTHWQDYEALSKGLHKKLQFKPITAFHHNGTKDVITAKFRNGQSVTCTPDHQFFRQAKTNVAGKATRGRIFEVSIGDVPLDNVYKNKLLCAHTVPSFRESQVPYDNDTLYALGAYIAEGSVPSHNMIDIAQSKPTEIRTLIPTWAENNNLNCQVTDTVLRVSLATRPDLVSLFDDCGRVCENKRIPDCVLSAPPSQLIHLLRGYLTGDGHDETSRQQDSRGFADNTVWSCVTTSSKLAEQLQQICLKLGTPVHTSYSEPLNKRPIWSLQYNPKSTFCTGLVGGDFSAVSIRSRVSAGTVPVCDISVADNHNYVLSSGLLVHNCSDGVDLARTFPDCVIDDPNRGLYLRCPKCKYIINDTQQGRYVPHNPGADFPSYSVSQLSSDFISLKEIWSFYKTTTNIAEFFNGKLGLPYVDEENRGVSMDQLMACVDDTQQWGTSQKKTGGGCAMGVDQGAGYVVVVIGDKAPNGKKRIRHVEIIENNNPRYMENGLKVTPFMRLRELMKEYDVRICVVDAMPNSNDALSFAQDFRSRVFLAWYQRDAKHVVQWLDKKKAGEGIRKAGSFLKFKYTVTLARYLSLGAMLGGWANGDYICPDPRKLTQICRSEQTNQLHGEAVCERLFNHMCRLIRQFKITNEETGEGRHDWIYTGGDPHLAHAMNYLNVAIERLNTQVLFTFV